MSSITEVAKLAGVSIATASRVVSEADYPVSAATRERVLAAARTLDYVPNALARGLLKRQVPVVGVIVHDITDPYFAEVVRGVEDAASPSGYLVITCSTERDADREREYLRLLRSMRAAGVIFAGSGRDDPALNEDLQRHIDGIREVGGAVVHLSPHGSGAPNVSTDNEGGIASLVVAIARLGHDRIAFLAGPAALFVARNRLDGYRRGLAEAGLEVDERLIVRTSFDREGGTLGVDTLLAGDAPFTAIVCANDLLALGALGRLAELGIRVPDDVSVAGFDDIGVAALTAPALTTVRIHLRELGRRGFDAVARVLDGADAGHEDLAVDVVMRASTAPPPATPLPLPFIAPFVEPLAAATVAAAPVAAAASAPTLTTATPTTPPGGTS